LTRLKKVTSIAGIEEREEIKIGYNTEKGHKQ
jgi:hypothetical protein